MINMFVKTTVEDYDKWLSVFQQQMTNREAAGLFCEYIWQDPDAPNVAFTLFRVDDRAKCDAHMASPQSVETGVAAGVLESHIQYLHTV